MPHQLSSSFARIDASKKWKNSIRSPFRCSASLGGAIYMNASCYGSCISDNLIDVCVFNKEGDELTIPKNDLNLEWRKTLFHKRPDLFIYSARFRTNICTAERQSKQQQVKHNRTNYQERKSPNLGSVFATTDIYAEISSRSILLRLVLLILKAMSRTPFIDGHSFYSKHARFALLSCLRLNHLSTTIPKSANCIVNPSHSSADTLIGLIFAYQKKTKLP